MPRVLRHARFGELRDGPAPVFGADHLKNVEQTRQKFKGG